MTFILAITPGGSVGIFAAAVFFIIFLGVAFVAFKALKKTVKMAFRIAVVCVILAVAIAGSIALWAFSGSVGTGDRPRATRPR